MASIIATVKLSPGEVGYFDDLTRIHLTLGQPRASVYDYMNTTKLLKSVRSKTLILESGTLNPVQKIKPIVKPIVVEEIIDPVIEPTIDPVTEPVVDITKEVIEEMAVEENIEEVVVEEKAAKKKVSKKKK